MARPLKAQPLTDYRKRVLSSLGAVQKNPVPHGSHLLQLVVKALLRRMQRLDPATASQSAAIVKILAAHEQRLKGPLRSAFKTESEKVISFLTCNDQLIRNLVKALAFTKVSRSNHWGGTIKAQRDVLAAYLTVAPFPLNVRNDALRELWFKEHGPPLVKSLTLYPCLCPYTASLEEAPLQAIKKCESHAVLIRLLLAHLHNTTPENIRKLLKPSK